MVIIIMIMVVMVKATIVIIYLSESKFSNRFYFLGIYIK